jgi:hypothetical protein
MSNRCLLEKKYELCRSCMCIRVAALVYLTFGTSLVHHFSSLVAVLSLAPRTSFVSHVITDYRKLEVRGMAASGVTFIPAFVGIRLATLAM